MNILIVGAFGQDAYYFAKNLGSKNNSIYLSYRRKQRCEKYINLKCRNTFIKLNLENQKKIENFLKSKKIKLIINLAASYKKNYEELLKINYKYNLNFLNAILKIDPEIVYVYSSSSSIFGNNKSIKSIKFNPQTEYAKTKLLSHRTNVKYRNKYNLNIYNLIFFNHFSLLQKENFLFKKVYNYLNNVSKNKKKIKPLNIGNIESKRDWSHASDIAKSSIKIIKNHEKGDYFINSGKKIKVKKLIEFTLQYFVINYTFKDGNFYMENEKLFNISSEFIRKNDFEVESLSKSPFIKNNPYRKNHKTVKESIIRIDRF